MYESTMSLNTHTYEYMCAKSLQLCPTLCSPMDCSLPSSSVHAILQTRILEWVAMPFSRGSSQLRIEPMSLMSPVLAGGFFTTSANWEAHMNIYELYKIIYTHISTYTHTCNCSKTFLMLEVVH